MSESKVCIIQPGNIGDIIICLPIAKKLHDQGHHVYWIVWSHLCSHFVKGNIDYVQFVSVPMNSNWYEWSHNFCKEHDARAIDLTFTQPGSWHTNNTKQYQQQREHSFDQFKYFLAETDFDLKWNLHINRLPERENKLTESLIKNENQKICLYCVTSSDTKRDIKIDDSSYSGKLIEIKPVTDCVFDWLGLLERCDDLILVESCFSNLVDQLDILPKNSTLLLKHGYYGDKLTDNRHKGMPVLRGDWNIR